MLVDIPHGVGVHYASVTCKCSHTAPVGFRLVVVFGHNQLIWGARVMRLSSGVSSGVFGLWRAVYATRQTYPSSARQRRAVRTEHRQHGNALAG